MNAHGAASIAARLVLGRATRMMTAVGIVVFIVREILRARNRPRLSHQRLFDVTPARLERFLLGKSRQHIAAALGTPPITTPAPTHSDRVTPARPVHWRADTWYYPINSARGLGIAIRFDHGVAQVVEIIGSPVAPMHSQRA